MIRQVAFAMVLSFLTQSVKRTNLLVRALSSTINTSTTPKGFVRNISVPGLKNGMGYVKLGDSDLVVPKVCMGTMTFGQQNTIDEGVDQLDLALDEYGVNFLDTAEIYPVPTKAETQGSTDAAIAKFLKNRKREEIILATKVAGRADQMTWLRDNGEGSKVTRSQILESVDKSLKRLGTDYIDLLQIHWPDRYTGGLFGQPDFEADKLKESTEFEEQLSALNDVIKAGKVRYIGVSNETPFGVCSMVELAKREPDLYPKIVSIQNSYSLVVRKDFEAGLAEACHHHNVGLLPYSPLAGGVLTGKYVDPEKVPEGARLKMFKGYMERYLGSQNEAATKAYCDIAKDAKISPTELALSWCYHRSHVASTIIGATTIEQLNENIKAYDVILEDETLEKIAEVYKKYTDPTKAM